MARTNDRYPPARDPHIDAPRRLGDADRRSGSLLARVLFPAQVLACIALGIGSTGGGCGPGGDPLPATNIACTASEAAGVEAPPDPTKPFVWLGTTDAAGAFRAIEPDEVLGVVYGPQGGQHVWGAARLYTPAEDLWTLRFALTGADGADLAGVTLAAQSCAGGIVEVTYVTVFLQANPPVSGVLSVDAAAAGDGGASGDEVHAEVPIQVH